MGIFKRDVEMLESHMCFMLKRNPTFPCAHGLNYRFISTVSLQDTEILTSGPVKNAAETE